GSTGKPDLAAVRNYVEGVMAAGPARPSTWRALPDSPVGTTQDDPPAGTGILPGRLRAVGRMLELLRRDPGPVVDVLTEISVRRAVDLELESAISTLAGASAEVIGNRPGQVPRMAVFMPSNLLLYSYVLHVVVPSLFT